ncbi:MAG: GAF domain-containing protein [Anaerolineales bacterium]|nr:GAF domain-containing protein [Anaerolineales bacterium]
MANRTLLDLMWIALSAGLVLLLQAGFLSMEVGLSRSKNSTNVAIRNLLSFGLATLIFFAVGYGLMFGHGAGAFPNFTDSGSALYFLFQLMLCVTAVTIISGATAERLRLSGYLLVTLLVAGLIYPVAGRWGWSGLLTGQVEGWLRGLGFYDFAGATLLHGVGGWAALAILLLVGARTGRFLPDGSPRPIPGSSTPTAAFGVILLMLGWLGLTGGSDLGFTVNTGRIIVNTILGGASGLVFGIVYALVRFRQIRVRLGLHGPIAGLVAISAAASVVTPGAAILIGAGGALAMIGSSWLLERFRIDDTVNAVPVHLFAGIWGTLAVGLWGELNLIGSGLDRPEQIGIQLLGVAVTALWSFGPIIAIGWLVNRIFPLRISASEEELGLNIVEHGASTDLVDFFRILEAHASTGDLGQRVPVAPFTQIGQIAQRYNAVLDRIEHSTARAELILDHTRNGILTVDKDMLIVTGANPMADQIFQTQPGELLDQGINWLMSTSYVGSEHTGDLQTALQNSAFSSQVIQLQGRRLTGELFPLEVTAAIATLDSKEHFILTIQDITERLAAQNTVREAHQLLQTVVRNAPLMLFVLDDKGHLLLSEGRALSDLGLRPGENVGRSIFDVYENLPVMKENVRATLNGEERQWLINLRDKHYDTTTVPLYDDLGSLNGLLGVSLDVTARKKAEDSQQKLIEMLATGAQIAEQISVILDSENLMQKIVELLKDRLDYYHVQIFAMAEGEQALQAVGASGRLGQSLRAFGVHEIELDHSSSLTARAARTREIVLVNDVAQEKDYLAHPLLSNTRSELAVPLLNQGKVVGVLDILDIRVDRFSQAEVYLFGNLAGMIANFLVNANLFEEHKQQAKLLAQQETRTRTLYEVATNSELSQDEQLQIALMTACEVLQIDAAVITRIDGKQVYYDTSHDPFNILANVTRQPLKTSYSIAAIRMRDVVAVHDVPNSPLRLLPGFQQFKAHSYIGAPFSVAGEIYGTVDFLHRDVRAPFTPADKNFVGLLSEWIATSLERAFAAEELAKARDEAVQADAFKTEMLAKVSHELKTPLGVIIGYAELMQDGRYGPVNDNQRSKAAKIADSARYLTSLVSELLDISRATAGTLKLFYETIDPIRFLSETSDELRPLVEEKGLRFDVTFDNTIPTTIRTDPGKVRQIVINLVTNAAKFTDQGFIRLTARGGPSETWQLLIEDSGIGIPREQQATIFEPFKQVDGSPTKQKGGAGLGLAIVKQIVDLMHGEIKLVSDEGYGSRFEISIPVDPESIVIVPTEKRDVRKPEQAYANGTRR